MPITPEQMRAAVQAYVTGFSNADVEAIVDLYAADATVEDPVGTPLKVGHAAIRKFYEESIKTGAKLQLMGPVRTATDQCAFAFQAQLYFEDKGIEVDVIDTFRFNEDGKVIEMRAFFGPDNMKTIGVQ